MSDLKNIVDKVEKACGKGTLMQIGKKNMEHVECVSTGLISLDKALGGGFPKGRVVELYGPESSGKSTLALSVIAQSQKNNGIAAFIDAEHALDLSWARKLGVDINNLLLSQPDYGEQALDVVEQLILSNKIDVIVVDSVASLVPKAELEGEMGQSHMGLQARLMSQALRKLSGILQKSKTCLIFINQIRMKIGVMFGNPETTPGGNALKFYSSIRLDIRRTSALKNPDGSFAGNKVRAKVVKNKVFPPFQIAEFDVLFKHGLDFLGDLIDAAEREGIISKSGAWYGYDQIKLGQGKEKTKEFLQQNPEILNDIEQKIGEQNAIH